VNGTIHKVNYLASLNSTETNGMSQIADSNSDSNYDKDRFSRINYLSKIGIKASDKLILNFFGNYDKVTNDYDFQFDNTGLNDTNLNKSKTEQFRFGFSPKYSYANGEFNLNSSFSKIQRNYQEWNAWTNVLDFSQYASRSVSVDAFNKYKFSPEFVMVTGVSYQFFDMNSVTPYEFIDRKMTHFTIVDAYFSSVFNTKSGVNINMGGRYNSHSEYGNNVILNFNPSYNFKTKFPLKVLSSLSTAYVAPSLYQLYSQYGSINLKPEDNLTFESGFELTLFKNKLTLNAIGFYREQNNSIGFDATYHYANIEGLYNAKGVETMVLCALTSKVRCNVNYTFTQVDEALNRLIPKHKINASIDYSASKRLFINANYQYVDARNDAFYDGNTYEIVAIKLGSYQLLNALVKYELIQNRLSVFGNVTNILNSDFIENIGYSTRGRNFKIGMNLKF
ncbi:MAG: Vitamin transporter BtuB, partial [Bacteroidota bacterium]